MNRLSLCLLILAMPGPLLAQAKKDTELSVDIRKSANNLKQIGIAFFGVDIDKGFLPMDIVSKDGKALLSWRVAILPYLEEETLFKEFNLTEAWDSDQNKKLLAKMPKVYLAPRGKAEAGFTFYQSFSGPGTMMSGKKLGVAQIADGSSNTFMVVEAGTAVPWTKPADLPFDAAKPLPALGGVFDGAFLALFGDGTLRNMKKGVKEASIKKFITTAGNEEILDGDFEP